MSSHQLSKDFLWRRWHSFLGIWLVLFLIQHLITNSQAALWIGDDGVGFIRGANFLEELPYVRVIEILILALPFILHGWFGIKYLKSAAYNSIKSDGASPYLPYKRNRAYTWQRFTSWLLLVGIIAHVVQMRFLDAPETAEWQSKKSYMVRISFDEGLITLAKRLDVQILAPDEVEKIRGSLEELIGQDAGNESLKDQEIIQQKRWINALGKKPLNPKEVIAVAPSFGTAELLMVRDTFKSPLMMGLYSLFVIAACYHAFNGLWSAFITWGIMVTERSQHLFLKACHAMMALMLFLGLAAIWLTYWVNLPY